MSFLDRFRRKSLTIVHHDLPDVITGYPGWLPYDSYGAMYRKQPAVRTVVDFLARNIAQLNPKIFVRLDDDDRAEDHAHPVAQLLRAPNPSTTGYRFRRDLVADLAIYDRAYWRKESSRGLVTALVRIPPSRLAVEFDQDKLTTSYRFDGKALSRDQLVIFPGYHPDGGEQGVSPLETLRRTLAEEWAATNHREWYWRNAARHGGVIERPLEAPDWEPEARDRFLKLWSDSTRGVNAGGSPMLEDGMKWRAGSFSPVDSQYIEGRKLTQAEVALLYAPALAKLLSENSAQADSFHRQLYQDVLAPICRAIQDEIDLQLLSLPEFDQSDAYCEFNLAEKLKGSFEQTADVLVRSVGVPYMSVNEGRARLNMPKLESDEFDEPIKPMNVIYGGQPSVVTPTADPSRPPALASLAEFWERQKLRVMSDLGAVNGSGYHWQTSRWVRELRRLGIDEAEAHEIDEEARRSVLAAFDDGGLGAVEQVYQAYATMEQV